MPKLRAAVAIAICCALTAILAASAFGATKSVRVTKSGAKYGFSPKTLSIKKGDTVKWSWSGSVPHNVSGKGVKSKTGTKVSFSHKFSSAGTFKIVCTIHKALGQTMTVKVS